MRGPKKVRGALGGVLVAGCFNPSSGTGDGTEGVRDSEFGTGPASTASGDATDEVVDDGGSSSGVGGTTAQETTSTTNAGTTGLDGGDAGSPACETGTYDCNGDPADGCEEREVPVLSPPTLRSPSRSSYTGSIHAPASAGALRPVVRWTEVPSVCGAVSYELELEDSCSLGALDACDFASPEAVVRTEQTWAQPEADLPVRMEPPVGANFAWRVRACDASARCSEWSDTGNLRVGRTEQDLNGDGYADTFIRSSEGIDIYHGGGNFNGVADDRLTTMSNPRFVGDLDGDGYADIAGMIPGYEPCTGFGTVVQVVYGGDDLTTPRTQILCRTAGSPSVVTYVGEVGDLNGDGFDELPVAWGFGTTENSLMLFAGARELSNEPFIEPDASAFDIGYTVTYTTSQTLSGRGDYDGDGYGDLVIAGAGTADQAGRLHVLLGGTEMVSRFDVTVEGTACESVQWLARALDEDGDGLDDWALICTRDLAAEATFALLRGGTPQTGALSDVWSSDQPLRNTTPRLDFDGDATNEFLLGVSDGSPIIWRPGSSDPLQLDRYTRFTDSSLVDVADHNGDGRHDVVFGGDTRIARAGASTSFNVVPTILVPPSGATEDYLLGF